MNRITRVFHRSLAGAALLVLPLTSASAQIQQVCYTDSLSLLGTDWNRSVTVPKFDPALGTLQSINFMLSGHIEGTARVENTSPVSPCSASLAFQAQITLTRPDLSVIVVTIPIANFNDTLAPFDGTIDFRGPSGMTHSNIIANAMNNATSPPPLSDLVLFTGPAGAPGTITLPVSAVGTSTATGCGNIIQQFMTDASASATVCYNYTNSPPFFPTCNTALMASVGVPFSTQICVDDPDPADIITLTVSGLPLGATLTPPLPAVILPINQPFCTTLNWIPQNFQAGANVIVFTATDNHGNSFQCIITVMVAECHQIMALQQGNQAYNIFGHVYNTQLTQMIGAWPVTMTDMPTFPVPRSFTHGSDLIITGPRYVQVVMYNPLIFPNNPSQWSRAMRLNFEPSGNISTTHLGTRNGISVRLQTITDIHGQRFMRFPFTIDGMP
jgi:hypothetical protein